MPNEELIQAQGEALWNANLNMLAAADRNLDGIQTITDTGMLIKGIFFLPGDFLFTHLMMYVPSLAVYFELDAGSLYSGWAGFWSALGWMGVAGTTVAVLSALAIVSIKVGEFMKSLRLLEALSLPVLVLLPFILSIAVDRWMHGALDTALILAVLAEIAFVLFYWGKLRR